MSTKVGEGNSSPEVKQQDPSKCASSRVLIITGLVIAALATTIAILALHFGWTAATPGIFLTSLGGLGTAIFIALLIASCCRKPDDESTFVPFTGPGHRLHGEPQKESSTEATT